LTCGEWRLPPLDAFRGLARDDARERIRITVGQFEADLARHRRSKHDRPVEAGSLDEFHDQRNVEIGVQPP
jgi:hypothetical protein